MVNMRLPKVEDFKQYGRFHGIENLDMYHEIPLDILFYVFPNYIFSKEKISKKMMNDLRLHCILCERSAKYEDKVTTLNDQKELQIRRLEERIKNNCIAKNI